jgi:hypothetical protein
MLRDGQTEVFIGCGPKVKQAPLSILRYSALVIRAISSATTAA